MANPVAVRINESKCPTLIPDTEWIEFEDFETLSTAYAISQPKHDEDTWIHVSIMFDTHDVIDCGMYLNKEGNINFTDLASDIYYSLSQGNQPKELVECLWPLLSTMEFTYH